MIDLSIIIPIYNMENYLQQCINSVLQQINNRIEIVCVNDGSTDGSLSILNEFKKKDNRVVVVNKDNTGYGDSINQGINMSRGKYVAILESDDYAVEGAYFKLLDKALKNDADIVKGNYYNYNSISDEVLYFENLKEHRYNELIDIETDRKLFFTGPAIWSAIYKKSFLMQNELYFLPTLGASYQDTSFAFKVWACAKKIVLINEPIIFYRQDNITSSSNNSEKVFDICKELNEMENFLKRRNLEQYMPECMVAKFRSMKWTLDRLQGENKLRFLLFMHTNAKKDCINGYFRKELWCPYDWMIMNNILFNVNNFAEKLIQGSESTSSLENVINILSKISEVYIYNTDYYAGKLYGEMVENGVQPAGFLSDGVVVETRNSIIPGEALPLDAVQNSKGIIVINSNDINLHKLMDKLDNQNLNNYILVDVRKVW